MKSLKTTLLVFVLFLLCISSFAQLSGGTYTIGGTTPDYATPQDAVTALASGVSGPVVFNIRPGIYPGKLNFGNIPGSSAVNTVTFKAENGDSTSVIITDSSSALNSSNFTVFVFGTDFLTFRNLTIERPGTANYATVMLIGANSRYLQVRNCILQSDKINGTNNNTSLVSFPLATINDSNIIFSNCVFNRGYYALSIVGQSNSLLIPLTEISGNTFNAQNGGGIQLVFANTPTITGNTITTVTPATAYKGISLRRVQNQFTVSGNKVTGVGPGQALSLDTCSSSPGSEAIIANNFFQTRGTGTAYGIYLSQCASLNFYYNTVNVTTTGPNNSAFRFNNSTNSLITVKNNILVNTGGGYTFYVPAGALGNFASSDYNNLYVGGNSPAIAYVDTGMATTFSSWQTASGQDANSVSGNPQFVSATDLHSGSTVVNDLGTPIPGITTDIDGQLRSVTTPDIGADEFTPLTDNLGVISFISPTNGNCGDSSTVVGVLIRNFGLSTQTGFDVNAEVSGALSVTLTETFSNSIPTNAYDTVYFSQTLNMYAGGTISIKAYTSLAGDQYTFNDTIVSAFTFGGHPDMPVAISPQTQCDNNVSITASTDSGNVLQWYDQPSGGNLLYIGQNFSPAISGDTTFYVEARTGSGTAGCLRITEIDLSFDYIEIQNISATNFDATGWQVIASNDYVDINEISDSTWKLGVLTAGEIQYRTDVSSDNFWGINLNWEPGTGSPGWAMIIDQNYEVVDFVAWSWDSLTITTLNITVDGNAITVGPEWLGGGKITCPTTVENLQRTGSNDNNNAADFACAAPTKGTQNSGLQSVFINCGIGACPSPRLPVDVTLVPGITTFLGNDTIVSSGFSMTLDAGAGFYSYAWSTGDTTQTLSVNTVGTYWVTVTGGADSCTYTDSIKILLNVGANALITADEIIFYPNPATDRIIISGDESLLSNAVITVTDLQGRVGTIRKINNNKQTVLNLENLKEGVYFLRIVSGNKFTVRKFTVIR